MGVPGLWDAVKKTKVPDVLVFLAGKHIGIDLPIAVMKRFMSGNTSAEELAEHFVAQYKDWMACDQAPASVVYAFDAKHNPLKKDEHDRRAEARRRAQENQEAKYELLERAKTGGDVSGVANSAAQKLLHRHTHLVVDEATNTPAVQLDVVGLEQAVLGSKDVDGDGTSGVAVAPDAIRPKPGPEVYSAIMDAFDAHGVPYIISENEAERALSAMSVRGELDVVISDDGDTLPGGAACVLRNFDPFDAAGKEKSNEVVYLADVLRDLGITRPQLVDCCILSGCDFTAARGLPGIGFKTAVKLIKQFGDIEAVLRSPAGAAARYKLKTKYGQTVEEHFKFGDARTLFLDDTINQQQQQQAGGKRLASGEPA